jgi:methylase of polypeptide subunit release factors
MSASKYSLLKSFIAKADAGLAAEERLSLLLLAVAWRKMKIAENVSGSQFPKTIGELYELNNRVCSTSVKHALPPPVEARNTDELANSLPSELLTEPNLLGDLYQLLSLPSRKIAQSKVVTADKSLSSETLIAFTQLYTPAWVVQKLVDNCLPTGALERDYKLLDPACGAGHFLTYAFDRISGRTNALEAVHRIFGTDIDQKAVWIANLQLLLKLLEQGLIPDFQFENLIAVPPGDELLGSLARHWRHQFDAVVANPPYIGRKLMDRTLKAVLKELYPEAHSDLCGAFICYALDNLKPQGRLGFITQASILHLPSYENLRKRMFLENSKVISEELGTGVFPLSSGEKINSCLLVLERQDGQAPACENGSLAVVTVPSCATIAKTLGQVAEIRQGLATTNNARFVRNWWDVDQSDLNKRWFPYAKSGGSERWYIPIRHVVDWENNGERIKSRVAEAYPYLNGKTAWVVKNEQFYFRPGLSFSFVNSRRLAVRTLPPGCIFDVACSAIFPADEETAFIHAFLNSSAGTYLAQQINPTINFQVGDLKRISIPSFSKRQKEELALLAVEAETAKRELCNLDISARECDQPHSLSRDRFIGVLGRLNRAEESIDELVSHAIPLEDQHLLPVSQYRIPDEREFEFIRAFHRWKLELTEPTVTDDLGFFQQFSKFQQKYLYKSPYFFHASLDGSVLLFSQAHLRDRHPKLKAVWSALPHDWTGKDVVGLLEKDPGFSGSVRLFDLAY